MWKIVDKADSTPEILVYGEISDSGSLLSETVGSSDFARALSDLDGSNVTVRINSCGGDVFAATAMYNSLKSHNGKVTVIVDGLAASAASIVVMAGTEVIMPANSLMMIHNPMAGLNDYYTADDLSKQAETLEKVKESIITAYLSRAHVSKETLARMMDNETWLDAQECVNLGFADRVEGEVEAVLDKKALIINSVSYDTAHFKNLKALKKRVKEVERMTKFELLLNTLGLLNEVETPAPVVDKAETPAPVAEIVPSVDVDALKAEAVKDERARVAALDALRGESAAANAVIDTAKANGATAEDIQPYLDAIARAEAVPDAAKSVSKAISADITDSGAAEVAPSPAVQDNNRANDEIKASVDRMVNFFNAKTKK